MDVINAVGSGCVVMQWLFYAGSHQMQVCPLVPVLNCCDLTNPKPSELLSQSICSHFCMERMIVTWRQVQRLEHVGLIQFHFQAQIEKLEG